MTIFFAEALKRSKLRPAAGWAASMRERSSGTCMSSTASSADHDPLSFALSTARNPAAVINPRSMSDSTRALFRRDQTLFDLRGVNLRTDRPSSRCRNLLSIQPKQRASSTASSSETPPGALCFLRKTNHTPDAELWLLLSHVRHSARLERRSSSRPDSCTRA
jgi:hypothetical protein